MKLNTLASLLFVTAIAAVISCGDDDKAVKKAIASLEGTWTAIELEVSNCSDSTIEEGVTALPCDDQDCLTLTITDSSYNQFTLMGGRVTNEGGDYNVAENIIALCAEDEQGTVCRSLEFSVSAVRQDTVKTSTLVLKGNNKDTGCKEKTTYTKIEFESP